MADSAADPPGASTTWPDAISIAPAPDPRQIVPACKPTQFSTASPIAA